MCETYILGKQSATPFPKISESNSEKRLELVHSGVCGPMRVRSLGGAVYFVRTAFEKFKAVAENRTERRIKICAWITALSIVLVTLQLAWSEVALNERSRKSACGKRRR